MSERRTPSGGPLPYGRGSVRLGVLAVGCALVVAASAAETVRIKNLKVLCVIYRGDPAGKDHMDDHAVLQAKNGCELGRLFYFRNSRAQLNCELHWMVFDQAAPKTEGPTLEHIEKHLKEQGVKPGQYDGVFVTGVGLSGNFGGFTILDGAGGCFGGHDVRGGLTWYPEDNPDVAYGTAWNFVHEFQHALDLVICERSGRKDMLHDHPYTDRNEPYFKGNYQGGEHWDWVALCLREFDGYLDIKGVTRTLLDCADADGDRLPDDDPRLPMDEKRFGSDPTRKDTDGDGLDDLGEFTADRYAGSDPRKPDTDADGLRDDQDPYPVVAIRPTLAYTSGAVPHTADLLTSVFARNDTRQAVQVPPTVKGAWNEGGLYLEFISPHGLKCVHAKIDGGASSGFWEGGDTYLIRLTGETVEFDGLGLSGPVPGGKLVAGGGGRGPGMFAAYFLPAKLGQGVSKEINYGGKREPQDVVDGLTLVEGRSIAFNFIFEFDDGKRALLTPLHTMYAVKLVKPADAPEVVLLRGPAQTNAALPTVQVLGTRAMSLADVVTDDGKVVGRRIGPGPVVLVDLDADGAYTLTARSREAKSEPHKLLVDRTAAPPTLKLEGNTLRAQCEPNAQFELWWGLEGTPVALLGAGRANQDGEVSLPLGTGAEKGWVVTGFDDMRFARKVFIESWPVIDKDFQDRRPDERLPPDNFAYRFEGYLQIDTPGRYTLELSSDDGSRLWIDDELVIDHWGHHGLSARTATVELSPGPHRTRIDYYEEDGWAGIKLRFAPAGKELTTDVPVRRLPVPIGEVELFGVQTDSLGNRSGFGAPVGPPGRSKGR